MLPSSLLTVHIPYYSRRHLEVPKSKGRAYSPRHRKQGRCSHSHICNITLPHLHLSKPMGSQKAGDFSLKTCCYHSSMEHQETSGGPTVGPDGPAELLSCCRRHHCCVSEHSTNALKSEVIFNFEQSFPILVISWLMLSHLDRATPSCGSRLH